MRILYILSGTEIDSGATKSFLTMLEGVVAAGHEVAVVCCDDLGVTRLLKEKGVKTFVCPYRFASLPTVAFTARDIIRFIPRFIRDRIVNPRSAKKVLGFARGFRPDIIHENTSVTGIGYHVASRLGIPLIIHIREYADKDFRIYLLNYRKRLGYSKSYPVAITKDLARYRCDRHAISRKATVVYNGIIDETSFACDSDKLPYFLYAGRIESNKGIEDLIDAYTGYRNTSGAGGKCLKLKVAGRAPYPAYFKRLDKKIQESGYAADIEWLGQCGNMDALYRKAAATIIPSYLEGFGRIAPEAMSKGSLCVMRKTGGLLEQLDNGVETTGGDIALGFESNSELSGLLKEIADNYTEGKVRYEAAYLQMIQRAQQTVKALYTKQAYCKNILQLYTNIMNDK